ncbi:MAG: penicillin-insensitive murein endopeptidase [Deltaproteobacteria bacterium]|nr:penicillin-insensitive murein endopeptidase [Deltaproteobacteria bacterium]MCB9787818.1 penicillin-insensitive murein endopeptidase [Deltaproteobacteria bacterium]
MNRALPAACAAALALSAVGARPAAAASVGTTAEGRLEGGFRLPLAGTWHRFAGPVRTRGTNYASLELAALIARAARTVARAVPGAPMVIGDASVEGGGAVARHASHRSGRDVDLLFYVRDARGRSVPSPGFRAFDGRGRCVAEGCSLRLDVPRTWWMIRTLLASRRPAVQYLFIAEPLARLLLAHARRRGEHPALLARAERVLHQPSDSTAHDDHIHLRVYCASADRPACVDTGPRWPWVDEDGRAETIAPERRRRVRPGSAAPAR